MCIEKFVYELTCARVPVEHLDDYRIGWLETY